MNKIEVKNSILKTVEQEVSQWLDQEPHITSGYDYETKLIEMGRRITKEIMVQSMGKLPGSRNEKKTDDMCRPS
jgi:hypothetical protein